MSHSVMISVAALSDEEHFVNILEHGARFLEVGMVPHALEGVQGFKNMSVRFVHHVIVIVRNGVFMAHVDDLEAVDGAIVNSGERGREDDPGICGS